MTDGSDRWRELDSVLDRVLDGIYDDDDLRRLNEILRADVEACRRYVHYVELHGRLAWGDAVGAAVELPHDSVGTAVEPLYRDEPPYQHLGERETDGDPSASSASLPIIIQTSPDLPAPYSPLGGFLFSYAVAAATVAIGLLVGWMYQVSVSQHPIAQQSSPRPAPTPIEKAPETQFVGRITGTFDCQWADASTAAIDRANVPLGRRYSLAFGLLEISYDSGAKVILQGPCVYQVDSAVGGYLTLGKLTARVEERREREKTIGEREEGKVAMVENVANQQSPIGNHKSPSPLSPLLSPLVSRPPSPVPLFSVRTPTAIVTDLGTEFAVEVEKSGASRAHVFLGTVEVRAAGSGSAKPVSLAANESARVDSGKNQVVAVIHESSRQRPFVRKMPRSVPIVLFNTGIGLKKGEADPHWQVVARSDDAKFKPQPAVVVRAGSPADLQNDRARSQWLSLFGDVVLPEDVVYVFRTTFDLKGASFARAALRGKFIADDRVVAIRLNGRNLNVPLQRDGEPFRYWTKFHAATGFVKGTNVLEVDVLNANPLTSPGQRRTAKSRMCCRVEMEGEVFRDAASTADAIPAETPRVPAREAETPTMDSKREARAGGS
jgi:hypothetical protein